jgi:hypothetical protein
MSRRTTALLLAIGILGVVVWFLVGRTSPEPTRGAEEVQDEVPSTASESNSGGAPQTETTPGEESFVRRSASAEIVVVISGPEGRPVPNCALIRDSGVREEIGRSDAHGECRILGLVDGPLEVEARCEGFCTVWATLSSSSDRQSIVLRRHCEISGSAACLDGATPAGLRVVAIPEGFDWAGRKTLDELLADPRVKSAAVWGDGSYSLGQLCDFDVYDVYAVCRGYLPTEYERSVSPPRSGLDLQVAKLFGIKLQYVDAAGHALEVGSSLYGSQTPSIQVPTGTTVLGNDLPDRFKTLAGLNPDVWREESRFDDLVLLTTRDASTEPGPLNFLASFPGYERSRGSVMVPELATFDEPPVHQVKLVRTTRGFGQLSVQFKGDVVNGLPAVPMKKTRSFLFLMNEDQTYIEIPMPDLSAGPHLVDGVPFGIYEVRFEWRSLPFHYPPDGVAATVVVDETTEHLEIDCSGMAAVRLEFPAGTQLGEGNIGVVVTERETSRTMMPMYSAAEECVIVGLLPGDYKFELLGTSLTTEWVHCPAGSVAKGVLRSP